MGGKLKPGRKGTQRFFDRKRRRRSAGGRPVPSPDGFDYPVRRR